MSDELTQMLQLERPMLQSMVEASVRKRVEQLKATYQDLAGVAVHAGVPYEFRYEPWFCWTRRSELKEDTPYYRYNVDEWEHFDHDLLAPTRPIVDSWNERFDHLHKRDPDRMLLDHHELAHLRQFHGALFRAMARLHEDRVFQSHGNSIYAVLWFIQAEHELVGESLAAFNSPIVVDEYWTEFR